MRKSDWVFVAVAVTVALLLGYAFILEVISSGTYLLLGLLILGVVFRYAWISTPPRT